jgi:hypothetical protein
MGWLVGAVGIENTVLLQIASVYATLQLCRLFQSVGFSMDE